MSVVQPMVPGEPWTRHKAARWLADFLNFIVVEDGVGDAVADGDGRTLAFVVYRDARGRGYTKEHIAQLLAFVLNDYAEQFSPQDLAGSLPIDYQGKNQP